jgi:glycosyltransferase involved in cell wall biosynthesis
VREGERTREFFIVEPNMVGFEHATVNSAFVDAFARLSVRRGCRVTVFCEKRHGQVLREALGHIAAVNWVDVRVVPGSRRKFLRKCLVEIVVIARILRRARRSGATVFILSIFPNTFFLLTLLEWLFKRVSVHVVLHTEVGSLTDKEKAVFYRQGFWIKRALFEVYDGSWPKLYVLGQGILDRFRDAFPGSRPAMSMRSIKHPYLFSQERPMEKTGDQSIIVGFIGSGREAKGITAFLELANSLRREAHPMCFRFQVVGGVGKDAGGRSLDAVEIMAAQPAGLPPDEYMDAIRNLDCAVFLYQKNYNLIASGAIFDAINSNVEIFSLQNLYFGDIAKFDVEGGIHFFESVEALETELRRRAMSGAGFRKFEYPEIRRMYSSTAVSVALESLIS